MKKKNTDIMIVSQVFEEVVMWGEDVCKIKSKKTECGMLNPSDSIRIESSP